MVDYEFNEAEEQIRAKWLNATIALYFAYPIFFFFSVVIFDEHMEAATLFKNLGHMTFDILKFFILWYCAYKKHGNTILSICIIGSIFALGYILYLLIDAYDTIFLALSLSSAITYLPFFILIPWWLIESFKLWNINKHYKLSFLYNSEEYKQALTLIQEAPNTKELHIKFKSSVRKCPKIHSALKKAYASKKAILEKEALQS